MTHRDGFSACLLLLMLALSGPASAQAPAAPLDAAEKRAVVEKAGELLNANYIFPDRAAEAKTKIDAGLAAGDYDAMSTPQAFAEKLTADLQSVTSDKHMRVFAAGAPPQPAPVAAAAPANPAPRLHAGFARIDRLKGNIGYIKLQGFPAPNGPFAVVANQAMADLAGTNALIIDMRDNGGGSPDGVAYLASFFFDSKTPLHINSFVNRKAGTLEFTNQDFHTRPVPTAYLDKPVYLLTSVRTFSGGEEFVYDLKVMKRARLIGAVTGGGANPGGTRPLNPRFSLFIPSGRAVNPVTKTNWEGTGVAPDVATDEKLAFQAAMREIVASDPAKYAALRSAVENQSAVDPFVEANLMKYRDAQQPGGEAAVRKLFEGISAGTPDYAIMPEGMGNNIRNNLTLYQTDLSKAGPAVTVKFTGVGPSGLDNYEITTATSIVRFSVYMADDGKVAQLNFGPPQPLPTTR